MHNSRFQELRRAFGVVSVFSSCLSFYWPLQCSSAR